MSLNDINNMNKFKTTGSTAHYLMTEPRGKADKENGKLSETTKTYLKEGVISQKFHRKQEIKSKFMEKGLTNEDMNLDFISKMLGIPKLINNKTRKENEYYSGEYDALYKQILIDLKSSWSVFTFGKMLFIENTQESIKKNLPIYYHQAQVYMDLGNKKIYKLIFILSNTPEEIIEKEFRFNNPDGLSPEEFRKKHIFDDIPDNEKIIVFDIVRDDEDIKLLKQKVKKARAFVKEIGN